jgi:nitrate reductase gamma subunit
VAIAIFIVTVIYRFLRVARTPAHLRWDLYPVPHEGFKKAKYGGSYYEELDWWTKPRHFSIISELSVMIPEIVFLKGVWESNRSLWFWSWAFHFALYMAIFTTVLMIISLVAGPVTAFGRILNSIAGIVLHVGYILGTIGCLGMLVKRFADKKLKDFSPFFTKFNLLFILAIFVTGLIAFYNFGQKGVIEQLQQFILSLVNINGNVVIGSAVYWHIAIVLLFMAYMPFTHMAHFVLKWFTYHSIRWNDEPVVNGSKLEKKISEALNYKPTWSAKHVQADGNKTWVDIATEEVYKDEEK